ncbi:hypothetical protein DL764_010075 [Monosporascus ibericus]|uniref:Uncharacterized protein n=1 Tax=Monosporascus ibericus TaxID=155417 RepID=A0A4Q4SWC7_9PEZI|nr:hypothetical protein DL764_010075 [Monosporascus ibericus]
MSNNPGSVMRAKLEESGEWDAWWEELLSRIPENIVRLFDPELEETPLAEPDYPSIEDVNRRATSATDLDETEMTKYKNFLQIHQFEKQRYDSLKQHAGASADEAVKLARAEYRRVLEKGRHVNLKDLHEWLEEWDIVMANAVKNDIFESVGLQWVDDFANVMAPLKAWYADQLRLAISRDEVDKLSYRTVKLPVRAVRGGAYVTAFGGESFAAESDQPADDASSLEPSRKRAGTNSQARDRNPKRDGRILEKNKREFDERMAFDAELRKEVEAIRKKALGNLESVMAQGQ